MARHQYVRCQEGLLGVINPKPGDYDNLVSLARRAQPSTILPTVPVGGTLYVNGSIINSNEESLYTMESRADSAPACPRTTQFRRTLTVWPEEGHREATAGARTSATLLCRICRQSNGSTISSSDYFPMPSIKRLTVNRGLGDYATPYHHSNARRHVGTSFRPPYRGKLDILMHFNTRSRSLLQPQSVRHFRRSPLHYGTHSATAGNWAVRRHYGRGSRV